MSKPIEPVAWLVEGKGTGGIPYRVATAHEAYSVARDGETSVALYTADQIREALDLLEGRGVSVDPCPNCGGETHYEGEPNDVVLICTRTDEIAEDCPGERRSGKDRRAPQEQGGDHEL